MKIKVPPNPSAIIPATPKAIISRLVKVIEVFTSPVTTNAAKRKGRNPIILINIAEKTGNHQYLVHTYT